MATQTFGADQTFQYGSGYVWNNSSTNWDTGAVWDPASQAVFGTDGETVIVDEVGGVIAAGIRFNLGTTVQGEKLLTGVCRYSDSRIAFMPTSVSILSVKLGVLLGLSLCICVCRLSFVFVAA